MNARLPIIALSVLCLAAPAHAMAPIQNYLNSGKAGQRDHSYPLMRCGALYMSSLKSAGEGLTPEKADRVMSTAMKMIAIAASFRVQPGEDATVVANGVMDEVETMVGEYGAAGGAALVKQDFKYCRNFAEPFARNYNMDPPRDDGAGERREPEPPSAPAPVAPPEDDDPEIRPGDHPGAPVIN